MKLECYFDKHFIKSNICEKFSVFEYFEKIWKKEKVSIETDWFALSYSYFILSFVRVSFDNIERVVTVVLYNKVIKQQRDSFLNSSITNMSEFFIKHH